MWEKAGEACVKPQYGCRNDRLGHWNDSDCCVGTGDDDSDESQSITMLFNFADVIGQLLYL